MKGRQRINMYSCNQYSSVYVWPDSLKRHLRFKQIFRNLECHDNNKNNNSKYKKPTRTMATTTTAAAKARRATTTTAIGRTTTAATTTRLCFLISVSSQRVRTNLFCKDLFCLNAVATLQDQDVHSSRENPVPV